MDIEKRIKETKVGYNYVIVTPQEILNWGGMCICDGCNKPFLTENMYLVWALTDTYCKSCFEKWKRRSLKYSKKDVNYDLSLQLGLSLRWYEYHLKYNKDLGGKDQ